MTTLEPRTIEDVANARVYTSQTTPDDARLTIDQQVPK
jgi:hypothetical protein